MENITFVNGNKDIEALFTWVEHDAILLHNKVVSIPEKYEISYNVPRARESKSIGIYLIIGDYDYWIGYISYKNEDDLELKFKLFVEYFYLKRPSNKGYLLEI